MRTRLTLQTTLATLATLATLTLICLTPACGPADEPALGEAIVGRAPALGKADTVDRADRTCQVVLRDVGRQPGNNDYQTQCVGGVCNYLWKGGVEIAEGLKGTVRVLYHRAGDPSWWQVDATPSAGSQPGFTRHEFSIHQHLFGPSSPAGAIELLPYLELPDGARLYDHNRLPGDFDNHVLDQAHGFGLGDGGVCAPQVGRVSFFGNWSQLQFGALRQGAYLSVDYSLDRLTTCRGTHNGYPAWDIVAYARFAPGGQLVSGSVRVFDSPQGQPTTVAQPKPLVVKIPADATAVELWFQNTTGVGSSCQAWDSNFGKNYRHDVWPAATDPRCQDVERWTTQHSDMPYTTLPHCLGYVVQQDLNADACELWPTAVGDGLMGHYGIPNNWLEVTIGVGPQQGTVLGVGLLTVYHDTATKAGGQRLTFAMPTGPGSWQTGFLTHRTGFQSVVGFDYAVDRVAFFVDVKRPSGMVVRLWQSRHGADYTWSDAFALPTSTTSIPYGTVKYASPGAAIFDARRSCDT